ncbi:MAG: KH domain-containing protein [Anaerolineales bacterium]
MQELIDYIARSLVDDPTEVSVSVREIGRELRVELSVAEEDMGRVIGRKGRVANAMRTLMRVISSRQGTRSSLDII